MTPLTRNFKLNENLKCKMVYGFTVTGNLKSVAVQVQIRPPLQADSDRTARGGYDLKFTVTFTVGSSCDRTIKLFTVSRVQLEVASSRCCVS